MQTTAVNVFTLCVPCANRCRYCLLAYSGCTRGAEWTRSMQYAAQMRDWLRQARPETSFAFYFGHSMEHPQLPEAIDQLRALGSPMADFLQFNGMRMRSGAELAALLAGVRDHGVRLLNLTFYGLQAYHDRFSARQGDFDWQLEVMREAQRQELPVEIGIPLTQESAPQLDALLMRLEPYRPSRIFCFVPHGEGRGVLLDDVRLTAADVERPSVRGRKLLNGERYKPERQWLEGELPEPGARRVVSIALTEDNIAQLEKEPFQSTVEAVERLDDAYYDALPPRRELAACYGDPQGEALYTAYDLALHYERRYIAEHGLTLYDIHDERQSFVRRY